MFSHRTTRCIFTEGPERRRIRVYLAAEVINHVTQRGMMPAELLYESPFTDMSLQGPEGLFTEARVDDLVAVLDRIRSTAMAS